MRNITGKQQIGAALDDGGICASRLKRSGKRGRQFVIHLGTEHLRKYRGATCGNLRDAESPDRQNTSLSMPVITHSSVLNVPNLFRIPLCAQPNSSIFDFGQGKGDVVAMRVRVPFRRVNPFQHGNTVFARQSFLALRSLLRPIDAAFHLRNPDPFPSP